MTDESASERLVLRPWTADDAEAAACSRTAATSLPAHRGRAPSETYVDPREARAGWQKIVDMLFLDDVDGCATRTSAMACLGALGNFIPGGKAAAKGSDGLLGAVKAWRKSCNSFAPGTHVLMADGTTKPIRHCAEFLN